MSIGGSSPCNRTAPMLIRSLPDSLRSLLAAFAACFTLRAADPGRGRHPVASRWPWAARRGLGTTTATVPAATGPPGATAGSCWGYSWTCRCGPARPGGTPRRPRAHPAQAGPRTAGRPHRARRRPAGAPGGDAADLGAALRGLPTQVSITARLRSDAALCEPPPPRRAGQRGRPRTRGPRLPDLAHLASRTCDGWTPVTLSCDGTRTQRAILTLRCRWPGALGRQLVQVVLSRRPGAPDGDDLAIVSTDLPSTPAQLIERYAARWGVATMFLQARHLARVGQARTRTRASLERVVPSGWSAPAWRSSGTPTTASPPPISPASAPARPGTGTSRQSRSPTCSARSGAHSW
jgi:hypothetical protein